MAVVTEAAKFLILHALIILCVGTLIASIFVIYKARIEFVKERADIYWRLQSVRQKIKKRFITGFALAACSFIIFLLVVMTSKYLLDRSFLYPSYLLFAALLLGGITLLLCFLKVIPSISIFRTHKRIQSPLFLVLTMIFLVLMRLVSGKLLGMSTMEATVNVIKWTLTTIVFLAFPCGLIIGERENKQLAAKAIIFVGVGGAVFGILRGFREIDAVAVIMSPMAFCALIIFVAFLDYCLLFHNVASFKSKTIILAADVLKILPGGQYLFGRIALRGKKTASRLLAIERLNDQTLIARIAMHDEDEFIRYLANNCLTDHVLLAEMGMWVRPELTKKVVDPFLLEKIALETKSLGSCQAATEKITEQEILARIATGCCAGVRKPSRDLTMSEIQDRADKESERGNVGYSDYSHYYIPDILSKKDAVRRIKDLKLLEGIAKDAEYWDVRMEAIARLTDQAALSKIAKEAKYPNERKAALMKVFDEHLLSVIALEEVNTNVRKAALTKLTDPVMLYKVSRKVGDTDFQVIAIEKITDQQFLAQIAKEDIAPEVRRSAVEKLTDQLVLAEIVVMDVDWGVRKAAVDKITDQTILMKLATGNASEYLGSLIGHIMVKITDQSLITEIAVGSGSVLLRSAAISHLTDQNTIARLALTDTEGNIGVYAVHKLTDKACLEKVALEASHRLVRQRAIDKLTKKVWLKTF
jgi:hypothetical protein